MQQGLPTADVLTGAVQATLDGEVVDVSSLSVDREFPDSLPGGGSFAAASGAVSFSSGTRVEGRASTPWDPTPGAPRPATPVSISMDVGMGPVSILPKGRVSDTSGGTGTREHNVGFTDLYQKLDRTISWDPFAHQLPIPFGTPGIANGTMRFFGLESTWVVDRIFRHCGFYATPGPSPFGTVVLSATMMGSTWPEIGEIRTSVKETSPTPVAPVFIPSPWGLVAERVSATYTPAGSASRRLSVSGPLEFTVMRTDGVSSINAMAGANRIQAVTGTSVGIYANTGAQGSPSVLAQSNWQAGEEVATARIEALSSNTGRGTIYFDSGRIVTGSVTTFTDTTVINSAVSSFELTGSGNVGAFQVVWPGTADPAVAGRPALDFKPTARIHVRTSGPRNTLKVLPPMVTRKCPGILQDLALANLATFWIDEHGVMQWWDLDALEARSSVATLTAADHVVGFDWSDSLASVKSRVTVEWNDTIVNSSGAQVVDFWRGTGETLNVAERPQSIEIINPPSDEVWLLPDLNFDELSVSGTLLDYNTGRGSWFGGVEDGTGSWATGLFLQAVKIGPDAYRFLTLGSISSGASSIVQKTPSEQASSSIWLSHRNENLPVFRGQVKYTLVPTTTMSGITGPQTEPELNLDVGYWIQDSAQAMAVANWYATRVTTPSPELSEVAIKPAPGLQLGDKITISDPVITGLIIVGVVNGDSRTMTATDGGLDMSHAIRIRPTSVSVDNGSTWAEWADAVSGDTWATWSTRQATAWDSWAFAPLAKEF